VFISIHIPKTAGTALGSMFDYGSGRRIFYDYKEDYSNATMDDLGWWREHKPFLERHFDFIHGHFFYEKYAELFPDGTFLTCLRHPVDRIISQFNHVYFERNQRDWQYRAIVEHSLGPADFATFEGIHDAYARHLAGRDIEEYEFVFTSELLDVAFKAFQVRYQFSSAADMPGKDSEGRIRRTNMAKNKVEVTQEMRKKIFALATEDVDIYVRGSERAKALIREAGFSV
jgi:hypothetical protein